MEGGLQISFQFDFWSRLQSPADQTESGLGTWSEGDLSCIRTITLIPFDEDAMEIGDDRSPSGICEGRGL